MYHYVVLGAGRMGAAIAADLAAESATERVDLLDQDADALRAAAAAAESGGAPRQRLRPVRAGVDEIGAVRAAFRDADVAVSAVPYEHNLLLTDLAIETGTHLLDLGGNPGIVRLQHRRDVAAREAGVAVVPDCGLAPGLANVLAGHALRAAHDARALRIRVGGLPQRPLGPLDYALLFSVHGLVNEYKEPAEALRDGRSVWLPSLEDVEAISFSGLPPLEAFNTSGGTGTMCASFEGRLPNLDYKTIRYPGHAAKVRLLFDLGLFEHAEVAPGITRRDVNEAALEEALDLPAADMTLVRVEVRDRVADGGESLVRSEIVDRHDGRWTSMQRMTGWPASITARLLADGTITGRGVLRNETDVPWPPLRDALERKGIRVVTVTAPALS